LIVDLKRLMFFVVRCFEDGICPTEIIMCNF
jgi:hypothetical protein